MKYGLSMEIINCTNSQVLRLVIFFKHKNLDFYWKQKVLSMQSY